MFSGSRDIEPAQYATAEFDVQKLVPIYMQGGLYIATGGTLAIVGGDNGYATFTVEDGQNFYGEVSKICPATTCSGIKVLIRGGRY